MKNNVHFYHISLNSSKNGKCLSRICTENQNTFYVQLPSSENRALFEIMWKSVVEPYKPQMTMWRIRIECWINKATDKHSEYIIFIAFYGNNGYRCAPKRYVILHCLSCLSFVTALT